MCWPRSCTGKTVLTGRGVGAGVRLAAVLCARDLLRHLGQPWNLAHQLHARTLLCPLAPTEMESSSHIHPRHPALARPCWAGLGRAHLSFIWLCAGPVICCCAQLLPVAEPCRRCVSIVCCLPAAGLPSCKKLRCTLQVSKQKHGDGSGSLGVPDDSRSEKSESCQHESMGL